MISALFGGGLTLSRRKQRPMPVIVGQIQLNLLGWSQRRRKIGIRVAQQIRPARVEPVSFFKPDASLAALALRVIEAGNRHADYPVPMGSHPETEVDRKSTRLNSSH